MYLTVSQSIRANGERHLANAVGYAAKGNLNYSAGSMRKALRQFKRADELDNWFNYPIREFGVMFECPPEQAELLKARMDECYRVTRENMNRAMFSDGTSAGASLLDFKRNYAREFWCRLRDAWQVLLGREHIGGDW